MVTFKVSLVCVFVLLVVHDACAWDTIRLSQIRSLTLNKGALTLGPDPVQQLTCVDDQNLCNLYSPNQVICTNIGRIREGIRWKCDGRLASGIQFNKLEVSCKRVKFSLDNELVYSGSCALRYSLEKPGKPGKPGPASLTSIIVTIIVVIIVIILIGFCCFKICKNDGSVTVYHDHSPMVRPTTNTVYTIPVQPTPVYSPPYYRPTTTNVVFSGTTYRNDDYNTHIDTGYSGTTFRNDDYDTHVDTGYSTTSFRNDDYSGGNDYSSGNTYTDTGFSGTSFR